MEVGRWKKLEYGSWKLEVLPVADVERTRKWFKNP
jgi:hypothetical protein